MPVMARRGPTISIREIKLEAPKDEVGSLPAIFRFTGKVRPETLPYEFSSALNVGINVLLIDASGWIAWNNEGPEISSITFSHNEKEYTVESFPGEKRFLKKIKKMLSEL